MTYSLLGIICPLIHELLVRTFHERTIRTLVLRIVSIRVAHKHWGADKIRAILKREHFSPLLGRTTIHRVLRQAGLINLRRKRIARLDNLRLVQDGGPDLQVNDE